FGTTPARQKFEFLAGRAWRSLPGTEDGLIEHFPQTRVLDRWLSLVYQQLDCHPGSYFADRDVLLAVDNTKKEKAVEQRFPPHLVEDGEMRSRGYPDAAVLSNRAMRWVYTSLPDPFFASAVVIDILSANPDVVFYESFF